MQYLHIVFSKSLQQYMNLDVDQFLDFQFFLRFLKNHQIKVNLVHLFLFYFVVFIRTVEINSHIKGQSINDSPSGFQRIFIVIRKIYPHQSKRYVLFYIRIIIERLHRDYILRIKIRKYLFYNLKRIVLIFSID